MTARFALPVSDTQQAELADTESIIGSHSRKDQGHLVSRADPFGGQSISVRFAQAPVVRVKRGCPRSPRFRRVEDPPTTLVVVAECQQVAMQPRVVHHVGSLAVSCEAEHWTSCGDVSSPARISIGIETL